MSKLRDVIAYICDQYPNPGELSKGRLTKLVYLADWKSALDHGRQITDINWYFNHYGPYVEDVAKAVKADPALDLVPTSTVFGSDKYLVRLVGDPGRGSLDAEDRAALDHVIEQTEGMYWNGFIELVYSTFPVLSQPRYSQLDLVALAEQYRQERRALTN